MLNIGWATRDITPNRPVMLQGQKHRRIAESALDPITVTAWALSDTSTAQQPADEAAKVSQDAVIVSCDLAFPSTGLLADVRQALARSIPELAPESVILCATHTHTSLVFENGLYDYPGESVLSPDECRAYVAERIVAAIREAWTARKPRVLRRAFGHAVVGHNRYGVYHDGHAEMYGNTNRDDFAYIGGYEDHSFDIYAVYEEGGGLSAVAPVVPCPAQVDEQLTQLSADYWHEVRETLRQANRRSESNPAEAGGLSVLPLCGAAGDQSPHLLLYKRQEAEMRSRRGITERQEIAERLLHGIERALGAGATDLSVTGHESSAGAQRVPLYHRCRIVHLTPREITQSDRNEAERLYNAALAASEADTWFPTRAKRVVDIFDGRVAAEPFPVELHTIRIGDAVLCTNPFELFLDYALQIKARSPAAQTSIIQLAGRGFYLPSRRAVEAGSYGAFPVVSAVGPRGGAELVEVTLNEIASVF